jgi:hypothetical protein
VALQRRDIVIAEIPDPDGKPAKHRHPAMVLLTQPGASEAYVVGISTKFDENRPPHWILLPHAPGGHPETGLVEPCVLKCDWVIRFPAIQLGPVIGQAPPEIYERATDFILREVERKKADQRQRGDAS